MFTVTFAFVWSSIFKRFSHSFFQHFISKATFLFNLWFQTLLFFLLFSTLAIYTFYFYYFRLSNFAKVFYLHPLQNQGRLMRKAFYMLPFSMTLSLSPTNISMTEGWKQNRSWEVKAKPFLRGESKTVLERWKQNYSWEGKAKPFLRGESKTVLESWKQNCSWEVKAKLFLRGESKTVLERGKQNHSWEVKAKSFLRGESKTVLERWKQNRSLEVKAKPFLRGESKTVLSALLFHSTYRHFCDRPSK